MKSFIAISRAPLSAQKLTAGDYEAPATFPCSNSAFKSSYSVLKMTSGIDPSTPRSDFLSWSSMKESSSQFYLESYKNWDFRVGNGYCDYLNNPHMKVNARNASERSFHSDSSEKPPVSLKALEKATFLRLCR